MDTHPDPAVLVVAATRLEAGAVRRAHPGATVVLTGVGLSRLPAGGEPRAGVVISCGLAGSVLAGVPTGTVLVPGVVVRPDGTELVCDSRAVAALRSASRRLGREPEPGPMCTAARLVTGAERARLAASGCVGVDMETGLLRAERVAAVRVVLDTPERELDPGWARPLTALLRPAAWSQLPWLLANSGRCARLAAGVLAAALRTGVD
jgi:4-hydroxy-3-methylbut-2-enyl diphosphate reductase